MRLAASVRTWLFRFGEDGTAPITLTQRRIFILPTRVGLLFALVVALMLTGAINYTLSLGHALVFLLVGLGLAGMVHTFRNLAGLQIVAGRPIPVFAGETARFPLYLINTRMQSRPALELHFDEQATVTTVAPPLGEGTASLPFVTTRRGWLAPGRITLATRYPIGLFRAWSYPHPSIRCLVYPRPVHRPLPAPTPIDTPGVQRGDAGREDFAGLRPWTPGDPPRHIAWKAAARAGEGAPLLVKHFSGGAGEELWLRWESTADTSAIEARLSILAGWVLGAEAAQLDYGLDLPGRRLSPDHGSAQRDACLEALALFTHETPAA